MSHLISAHSTQGQEAVIVGVLAAFGFAILMIPFLGFGPLLMGLVLFGVGTLAAQLYVDAQSRA